MNHALRHIMTVLPDGIEARVVEVESTAGAVHADVRYFAGDCAAYRAP